MKAAVCAGTFADQVAENALRPGVRGSNRIWWARCLLAQAPVRHDRGDPRQVREVAHREARSQRQCRCQRRPMACEHAGDCSSLLPCYVTVNPHLTANCPSHSIPLRSTARAPRKQVAVPHIPEEGGPRSRRVAAAAERPTGTATHGPCVLQPGCYACCQDGAHPRQPLACSRGKDSTARSILICFTEYPHLFHRVYPKLSLCVYTSLTQVYTSVQMYTHPHSCVYTLSLCLHTPPHSRVYTFSQRVYTSRQLSIHIYCVCIHISLPHR